MKEVAEAETVQTETSTQAGQMRDPAKEEIPSNERRKAALDIKEGHLRGGEG